MSVKIAVALGRSGRAGPAGTGRAASEPGSSVKIAAVTVTDRDPEAWQPPLNFLKCLDCHNRWALPLSRLLHRIRVTMGIPCELRNRTIGQRPQGPDQKIQV